MRNDFRRYWWGEVTSTFGSAFTSTGIAIVAVTALHASPIQVGMLAAGGYLPGCLLTPFAGVLADRVRRPRRCLALCEAAAGSAVAATAIGAGAGILSVGWLLVLTLVLGCVVVFVETLYFTHLTQLVSEDGVVTARSRLQSGEYGARTLGQALAGPGYASAGAALGFAVDAVSYVVSAACLLSLRAPERSTAAAGETPEPVARQIGEGLRWVNTHTSLRSLLGAMLLLSSTTGATAALTAPFVLRVLAVPTGLYSALFAFAGLAGLAGSVLGGRMARAGGRPPVLVLAGYAGMVAVTFALPAAAGALPVRTASALVGVAGPVFCGAVANLGLSGLISAEAPPAVLGRVVATLRTGTAAARVAGSLLGGVLGSILGTRAALWTAVLAGTPALVLFWRAWRAALPAPCGQVVRA